MTQFRPVYRPPKAPRRPNMVTVDFIDLHEPIIKMARKNHLSKSEFIRQCIRYALDNMEVKSGPHTAAQRHERRQGSHVSRPDGDT